MSQPATAAAPFRPTARQADFRAFVRALLDDPPIDAARELRPMAGDWLALQREYPERAITPQVGLKEWLRWERQEGFGAWWGQAFPEWATPTETDLLRLAALYYRGLVDHMQTGQPWAYQQMGRIEKDRRAIKATEGDLHEDLTSWLKKDTSGWRDEEEPPTAAGAPRGRTD